jgi:hypothetical protein
MALRMLAGTVINCSDYLRLVHAFEQMCTHAYVHFDRLLMSTLNETPLRAEQDTYDGSSSDSERNEMLCPETSGLGPAPVNSITSECSGRF